MFDRVPVVLSVCLFVAGLVSCSVSCDSDSKQQQGPAGGSNGANLQPSPVPSLIDPSLRQFARSVQSALESGDIEFFDSRMKTLRHVCTAEDVAWTGFGDACDYVGQEIEGIDVSLWRSDQGGVLPKADALAHIERLWKDALPGGMDSYGPAEAQVYALGGLQTVITTALTDTAQDGTRVGPGRVALISRWENNGVEWLLTGLMLASGEGAEDFLQPHPDARSFLGAWESFQP